MQRELAGAIQIFLNIGPQHLYGGYRADGIQVNIASVSLLLPHHAMVFRYRKLPSLTEFLDGSKPKVLIGR